LKNEVFKLLRCKCGKQSYEAKEVSPVPKCPRCEQPMKYSSDWYIKVIVDGKRHIQKVARQQRQAEAVLKQAQTEQYQAKFFGKEEEGPLLSDGLETVWKRKWKNNRDGAKSRRLVERIIEITGDLPLARFDETAYDDLIDTLEERELAQTTINRYRASLRTVLRRAKVPYDFIEMAAEDLGRIRVISKGEEEAMLALLRETTFTGLQAHYGEMLDLLPCLLDTGTRTSEMLDLPWQDVDFDSGLITIWRNKTATPRSVPMTKRVRAILEQRQQTNPERPWSYTLWQVDRIWKWLRRQLNLQDDKSFRIYCTRHTCATRLVAGGTDIYKVMKWLGHTSIKMTERYAHLDPQLLREAALILEPAQMSTDRQQLG
jgi:integrase